jgi:hypothetical protein
MFLKVTPPETNDAIASLVERSASQGSPSGVAHLWFMDAWAADMQRQMQGEPRRLESGSVDEESAIDLRKHGVSLLAMYVRFLDHALVDEVFSAASRQVLLQPRLRGLSSEEINNKLTIKDAYTMEGIEAHAMSLDIIDVLAEVDAILEATSPGRVGSPKPTQAPKKSWWRS